MVNHPFNVLVHLSSSVLFLQDRQCLKELGTQIRNSQDQESGFIQMEDTEVLVMTMNKFRKQPLIRGKASEAIKIEKAAYNHNCFVAVELLGSKAFFLFCFDLIGYLVTNITTYPLFCFNCT
jgi:hypothetical protein